MSKPLAQVHARLCAVLRSWYTSECGVRLLINNCNQVSPAFTHVMAAAIANGFGDTSNVGLRPVDLDLDGDVDQVSLAFRAMNGGFGGVYWYVVPAGQVLIS
jgi:hypothetical protein